MSHYFHRDKLRRKHKILKLANVLHVLQECLCRNRFALLARKELLVVEQFVPLYPEEKRGLSSKHTDIAYTKYLCFYLENYIH